MLASRCAAPPLDDLLSSKGVMDGAWGVLSCNVVADKVNDQRWVWENLQVGLCFVVVCQAIAKKQCTLCVWMFCHVLWPWPVEPNCDGVVAVKG